MCDFPHCWHRWLSLTRILYVTRCMHTITDTHNPFLCRKARIDRISPNLFQNPRISTRFILLQCLVSRIFIAIARHCAIVSGLSIEYNVTQPDILSVSSNTPVQSMTLPSGRVFISSAGDGALIRRPLSGVHINAKRLSRGRLDRRSVVDEYDSSCIRSLYSLRS